MRHATGSRKSNMASPKPEELLLSRLENRFGLKGQPLSWFRSYLTDRSYCVVYQGKTSCRIDLPCSVPQGSVLGPLLFVLYTADLASTFGVNLHAYADDTQLYLHGSILDTQTSAATLERCIENFGLWMSANRLKLNADKTELLWIGTKNMLGKLTDHGPALSVGSDVINPSSSVRLLGVTISPDLQLDKHLMAISAKCFFQLRQLRCVRRSLDEDSAATLVHAFVTSRIDYCNCLLAGAPRVLTDKLQRILNAAARVVTNTGKFEHGLSQLMHHKLHWLDVTERIKFRLGVTVFKSLHGLAPPYLADLCKPVTTSAGRSRLRSAASGTLCVPRVKLATYGTRAFAVAGPSFWNTLPDYLRNPALTLPVFKQQLKTFLFASY